MGVVKFGVDKVRELVRHLEEELEKDRTSRVVEVR